MKLLSSILAIFILVLCCLPCSDAGAAILEGTQHLSGERCPTTDPGEGHKDSCSPLCQCSCCTFAVALPVTSGNWQEVPLPVIDKIFSTQLAGSLVGIVLPFWQPPRPI